MNKNKFKALSSMTLLLVLSGCGTAVKQASLEGQEKPISIGYSLPLISELERGKAGVWARLDYASGKPVLTTLSLNKLERLKADEEVLVYSPTQRTLMPAYVSKGFNAGTNTFGCSIIGNPPKTDYHPCGSGSRLVTSDAMASAFQSVVGGLVTMGMAAGVAYRVDVDGIKKAADETKLLTLIDQYLSLKRSAEQANAAIVADDNRLISKADVGVKVVNQSGFNPPEIKPTHIGITFKREVSVKVPMQVSIGAESPFESLMAELQKDKIKALASREFYVSCPKDVRGIAFDSKVQCPSTAQMTNDQIRVTANITLSAASFGTRYPDTSVEDKKLAIRVKNGQLVLSNLTDKYLEVKSIAVYVGKEVQENSRDLSIPPQAENRPPLSIGALVSSTMEKAFTFDHVTKAALLGKATKFGVAVKYRLGDGGNFETLLSSQQVELLTLLD